MLPRQRVSLHAERASELLRKLDGVPAQLARMTPREQRRVAAGLGQMQDYTLGLACAHGLAAIAWATLDGSDVVEAQDQGEES